MATVSRVSVTTRSICTVQAAAERAAQELGYDSLKKLQLEVIEQVIRGFDIFAVLPTGYGKSLCYACLPLVYDQLSSPSLSAASIVVVVTPLTAIIRDQVRSFSARGLSVGHVTSDTEADILDRVASGQYQLVFFTPEMLIGSKKWRHLLKAGTYADRLKTLVIDEAHTVKTWGDTFRSTLHRIGEVRSLITRDVNVLAMTATATKSLRQKVSELIGLVNPIVIAASPCKRNIIYRVSSFSSLSVTFGPLLKRLAIDGINTPRVIVYCRRYDDCSNLYLYLKHGLDNLFTWPMGAPDLSRFRLVEMFTSSTDLEVKTQIIKSFTTESPLRVVCATVAFGMGLDCTDVREIVHFGSPDNIESYIQETGRSGRDDKPCLALLLVVSRFNRFSEKSIISYQQNTTLCRRDLLFQGMDNYQHVQLETQCMCCDVCAKKCLCGLCLYHQKSFILL